MYLIGWHRFQEAAAIRQAADHLHHGLFKQSIGIVIRE
jgi:hypothetical protein